MNRPGMTLLEVLLALALLGAIVAATASWTQITAALVAADGPVEHQRWNNAVQLIFDAIQQDLQCGDFAPPSAIQRAKSEEPKATVTDGRLIIRTRSTAGARGASSVVHEYRLDSATGKLQRTSRSASGEASQSRPLIDRVKAWTCAIADHQLDITVESTFGTTLTMRSRVP